MSETRSISRISTAKIASTIGAVLIAGSLGGCATFMQAFSAEQPTAALVEPASNSGAGASDDPDAATASVDSQWTTRVYHGWAGPSSQM